MSKIAAVKTAKNPHGVAIFPDEKLVAALHEGKMALITLFIWRIGAMKLLGTGAIEACAESPVSASWRQGDSMTRLLERRARRHHATQ